MRGLVLALLLAAPVCAGDALQRRDPAKVAHADRWLRAARRLGARAVLLPAGLTADPEQVPTEQVARTGEVLAVRAGAPPADFPEPPELPRRLYFTRFERRGPDQIPLTGQALLERWVDLGGAALSTFRQRERFTFVADAEVPAGDVMYALAFVVGGARRALRHDGEVLHLARRRAGQRQSLEDFLPGPATARWRMKPDRRRLRDALAEDATRAGLSLVLAEPLAERGVWVGGTARPGGFVWAAAQALPATAARLGKVAGVAAGRPPTPPRLLGVPARPWTRTGWVRAQEVMPLGYVVAPGTRLWIQLEAAPRVEARALLAWVARARKPVAMPAPAEELELEPDLESDLDDLELGL